MQAIALTRREFGANFDLVRGMHRLRARVFKDRLDWEVSVAGDMEIDRFDALDASYLLVVTPAREVVGCVRLLPTIGPNMLADTFPILLEGRMAPRDPRLVESSRFCVDTSRVAEAVENGLRRATHVLFAAMLEWGISHGQTGIVTVTDTRMERILRRAGWPLDRLGGAHLIGSTQALAGLLPVSGEVLTAVRRSGGLESSVLLARGAMPAAA